MFNGGTAKAGAAAAAAASEPAGIVAGGASLVAAALAVLALGMAGVCDGGRDPREAFSALSQSWPGGASAFDVLVLAVSVVGAPDDTSPAAGASLLSSAAACVDVDVSGTGSGAGSEPATPAVAVAVSFAISKDGASALATSATRGSLTPSGF